MATSTFASKITDLVGGTIDDDACDDWMTEGAKEIINQLPARLKEKCMTATGVGTDSVNEGTLPVLELINELGSFPMSNAMGRSQVFRDDEE